MKKFFPDPTDLDGYEDLKPEDQQKIMTAYEAGHVAEEDIPETAKKHDGEGGDDEEEEEEEKPKKKGGKKRKADDEGGEEDKPKKKAGGRAKVRLQGFSHLDSHRVSFFFFRKLPRKRTMKRNLRRRLNLGPR
jgi:hypothetical protein